MFDLKAVFFVGCIVLSSMFVHAMVNQSAVAEPSEREAFLRSTEGIIDAYREADWFTGTVAIFDGDALIFDQSYGLADIAQNIANESNTRLRIGSINKHFTAALVLREALNNE